MTAHAPVDIEAALRELASSLDVSPAPDYAARVVPLLEGAPRGRVVRLHPRPVSRLLLAAAVALVAALVTTFAVPASRHALASWFGFSGIEIRTAPTSWPPLPPLPTGPLPPYALGAGDRTTLRAAIAASGDRLALPSDLPRPRVVLEYEQNGATVITLAYRHAEGFEPTADTGFALLLTEVFDAGEPMLEKLLHNSAQAVQVDVNGAAGVYASGPQVIINLDRTRRDHGMEVMHEVDARSSADSIIWSVGTTTYRLEADMTEDVAVALAETVG